MSGRPQMKTLVGALLGTLALFMALGAVSALAEAEPLEVAEYRQDFEVSRAEAEETLEVQAEGAEADIVGGLEERLDGSYAGVWFNNSTGEFVVPALPDANRAAISNELAQDGLAGEYHTVPADSSWEELEAAQEQLNRTLSPLAVAGYVQTSIDPRTNAVVIHEAKSVSGGMQADIQREVSKAGVDAELRRENVEQFDPIPAECAWGDCDRPMPGGVGIGELNLGSGECTSGFKATDPKYPNKVYVLTAGHCARQEGIINQWQATALTPESITDRYLGFTEQALWGNGFDVAKINATGSEYWNVSPWPTEVVDWGRDGFNGQPVRVPITSESSSFIGEYACHSGLSSGTSCGSVVTVGLTTEIEESTEEGPIVQVVHNQSQIAPVCISGGDSGGPVFAGHIALGITSSRADDLPECQNHDTYSEITYDTNALGVTVAPRTPSTTQTIISNLIPLNGNPGWVTVKGEVHAPNGTINGKYVNLNLRKWENNEWVTKETLHPTVTNNHYEVVNWKVGNGKWLARVVFPEQAPFGESYTDPEREGNFEIKDGYRLVAKHSGKCLDTIGASYENGALMDQWECANPQTAQGQVFTLVPQGEYFQLVVRKSGRCLDVPGASQSDGIQLQQYTCLGAGQANQLWKLITLETVGGVNYFKLTAKHSGKCLDVAGGGTANGAKVQQWSCNGLNQQKWTFQSVESPAPATETTAAIPPNGTLNGQPGFVTVNGKVQAGAYPLAGKSLNVNYSKETSPGVWTYMNTSHPTLNADGTYSYPNWQVAAANWRVRTVFPGGEGLAESVSPFQYFTIKSGYRFVWRHSTKCMTLSENSAANGKPIIQWPCFSPPSPGDGQVFTLVPFPNGYEIKINSTGKCVDVTNVSTANGAKLQQWDCLGAGQTNQIWSLVELAGQPGWFAFIAAHSGKCAEVPSSSTANGAWFQQWTCNWTGNQQFAIQAIN
jgi:Ricin-type beta-trefoil lectin domain